MDIVLSFSALCILLVVGKLLRVEIRLFQKLYLPASVIGGLLGLVLVQTIGGSLPAATMAGWNQLPGFLINIVFSALFLGVFIPPIRRIWGIAGPQLAYGQIVAWGQYVVGLGVAIVLLTPVFGVPGAIGTIVPVGFEGGARHRRRVGAGLRRLCLARGQGLGSHVGDLRHPVRHHCRHGARQLGGAPGLHQAAEAH